MNGPFNTIKLIFIGVFFVCCVVIWGYQALYVWPRNKCEKHGGWFDPGTRTCGQVIYIPNLTGRVPGRPDIRGVPRQHGTYRPAPSAQPASST
jgi:hypothetical protein